MSSADAPHPDVDKVLFNAEEIAARLKELAVDVNAHYGEEELIVAGILKGAFLVIADFSRYLTCPTVFDFMAVSSYGASTTSSGVVRILKDLEFDIKDRHLLIVEDVIDSGLTLSYLLKNLGARGPKSIEILSLLVKPERVNADLHVRWTGFEVGNEFVIGYGMDCDESYRNLPYIGTLKPELYT